MRPIRLSHDPRALPAAVVGALGLLDLTLGVAQPHLFSVVFWPVALLGGGLARAACALALLLLARGLARRLRAAWLLTLALLASIAVMAPPARPCLALFALLPAALLLR